MNKTVKIFTCIIGATMGSTLAYGAVPEGNDDTKFGIEEIVTTARKRTENLQEVPIAVSAFNKSMLNDRSIFNLQEMGRYVPNLDFSSGQINGGGFNSQITIRGIGQTDFLVTTDPGVGTYVDGVYFARTMGGVMDLLDIERIEILRGPQGTLFGKNTIGGAVSITSSKPTGEFGGRAEVTIGKWNRIDARGNMDISIVEDKLAANVAVSSKNRDGYGVESDGSETGDENVAAARVQVDWKASDTMNILLAADVTRQRQGHLPTSFLAFEPNAGLMGLYNAVGGITGLWEPYILDIPEDPFYSPGAGDNINNLDAWGVSATVDWASDQMDVKSITAYRELSAIWGGDMDGDPTRAINQALNDNEQWQFSQEIQLSGDHMDDRLHWMVGAFYFRENAVDRNQVRFAVPLFAGLEALPGAIIPLGDPTNPATPFAGGAGNPVNIGFDIELDVLNDVDIESIAGFSHATFDITDRLNIFGGLRYTWESKNYFLSHRRINANVFAAGSPRTVEDSWSTLSPKAGLNFKATEDVMLYGSYSRGFKSGGFNGRPLLEAEVQSYDPEFVDSFEVGIKSVLFNNRLQVNLTGFYYNYSDIQLTAITQDAIGNLVITVTNAAKAKIKGLELEMQARPAPGLDLTVAIGYTDAGYSDIGTATGITLDSKLPKTPEWTASAGIQYSIPLDDHGFLTFQGDWSYKGKTYSDVQNFESAAQDGYSLFNARISYRTSGDEWEVALFGKNLTDKRYLLNASDVSGGQGVTYGWYARPREWGLSLSTQF
ncbi:MAG: TonB-dependent receptor [Alphaproteobacteria bacterium]|nr:MAG: TonB-dependent receptor [Alphaproteobacteria bacterium]